MPRTASPYRAGLVAMLALLAPQPARADSLPANAVILFGARWCAPCTAELHDLGAMLDRLAALPPGPRAHLVLAWIDRMPPHAAVPDGAPVLIPPPATAATWAEPLVARAHGLPFAAVTDARGQVCALHPGPMPPAVIGDLWARCHLPR